MARPTHCLNLATLEEALQLTEFRRIDTGGK
jgi:hypothetical protein